MTSRSETRDTPDTEWGPPVRGGRRRRWRWLLAAVVVLLVLPLLDMGAVVMRLSSSITRTDVTTLSGSHGGPINILVTGSDSRAGLTDEQRTELTTGSAEGERTDTIFLLSIAGSRAAILAFPRDLYVPRCDGTRGRINAALGIGGVDCLVDTVESLSGIGIDHYVAVSFGGFRDIVDAVGGVDLCVDKALKDPDAGIDLAAGCQRLNGVEALGYARTRKLDNDLKRIQRQQKFLSALADEIVTPSTALNPLRSYQLAGALGKALTADRGLGVTTLARLGNGARGLTGDDAVTATVPATDATIGGASVLEIDQSGAEKLFASFRDGSVLTGTSGATRAATRVQIANGAEVGGLAGRTRDVLVQAGYDVVGIGDAPARATSVIEYPAGQRANAQLLQRDLPVEVALQPGSGDVIRLVLGRDLADGP